MRIFHGLAAAGALLFSGAANAAVFYTTSSTANPVPGGYQFTVDGITMTITAGIYEDNAGGIVHPGLWNVRPRAYSIGLGATHDYDNEHTLDGNNGNEVLMISFDRNVVIEGFRFSYFDSEDDFDFFFDSNMDGVLNRIIGGIDIPNSGYKSMASLFTTAGDWFGVGADGKNDSFKLKAIKVTEVPEVPLPAALPLFLCGAGAVGFASRRKRKGAAA